MLWACSSSCLFLVLVVLGLVGLRSGVVAVGFLCRCLCLLGSGLCACACVCVCVFVFVGLFLFLSGFVVCMRKGTAEETCRQTIPKLPMHFGMVWGHTLLKPPEKRHTHVVVVVGLGSRTTPFSESSLDRSSQRGRAQ